MHMYRPVHLSVLLTFLVLVTGAGFYYQTKNKNLVEPTHAQTEQTSGEQKNSEPVILTTNDFSGYGRNQELRDNPTVRVEINPELEPFTFLITSFTTSTRGSIAIFASKNSTPDQIIELPDPNMRLADRIHEFFNATDINFDGYLDIGILTEGGAKWGAYQYWLFDKNTNTFVENNFTQAFRELNFNQIIFDESKKQITTNNFCGTLICFKDTYEVKNDHLVLREEYEQEQMYENNERVKKCTVTTKKYQGNSVKTTTEIIPDFCEGYYL